MSAILSFEAVGMGGDAPDRAGRVVDIDFSLGSGEIVMVQVDHDYEQVPFLDLALGLVQPDSGRVLFDGRDWSAMHYREQFQQRSRIGALSREPVWLANQTVLRNVLLGARHHTTLGELELEEQADALGRTVGLACVPRARPDAVAPRQLRMSGWVRAFLGNPALLVLLFPEDEAVSGWPKMLDRLLGDALQRGAAALVVSDQPAVAELSVMSSATHYGWQDGMWSRIGSHFKKRLMEVPNVIT